MERYQSPMAIRAALEADEWLEADIAGLNDVPKLRNEFAEQLPGRSEDARLVATELLNNAVEHRGGAPVLVTRIYGPRGIAIGTMQRDGSFLTPEQVETFFAGQPFPEGFVENGRGAGLFLLSRYAQGAYANVHNRQLYAVLLRNGGER